MIQLKHTTNLRQTNAQLSSITEMRQLRFAIAHAQTRLAAELQKTMRARMEEVFTIRSRYVLTSLKMEKATPQNLQAKVYHAMDFMEIQETGGTKFPRGKYIAIPLKTVLRTPKGMIKLSDRPKRLGDRAEVVEVEGKLYLSLKKGRNRFNGTKLKNGAKFSLLYRLIPQAHLKKRLGLEETGDALVASRFAPILDETLAAAVRTAQKPPSTS